MKHPAETDLPEDTRAPIDHPPTRYREMHRADFVSLLPRTGRVERVRSPNTPPGPIRTVARRAAESMDR